MYEERKNSFTFKDIILQLVMVVVFIFVLIWLFPTKGYLEKNFATKDEVSTLGEQLTQQLQALYGRMFADNVESMRDAGAGYFTTPRLPKNVGDSVTLTLAEMQEKKMVLEFKDSNNQSCDTSKSYVQLTKMDDEYQMKVQLTCSDYSDYIIVYMGCYSYCENAICESKPVTKPNTKPTDNGNKVPDPTPIVNKKYEYEYRLTTQNTYSDWSSWSSWSTTKVTPNLLTEVDMETRKVFQGYEDGTSNVRYEEKVVQDGYQTIKKPAIMTGGGYEYKPADKKTSQGYYTDWAYKGTITSTYARSNTNTEKYEYVSSKTSVDCTNVCKNVTTYTYKKWTRSYVSGKTTYTCPAGYPNKSAWFNDNHTCYRVVSQQASCSSYGSGYTLQGNQCVTSVPKYKTIREPIYEYEKGDAIYKNVTYYRYRTRTQLTVAGTVTKWSSSNNDQSLLKQGYVLTGNKKEV